MNFDSMEDTIYGGNVEQDEDLLAELMALQNEVVQERPGSSNVAKRGPAVQANLPSKQPASRPIAKDLHPADLANVLRDDIVVDEEAELSGAEDLESELLDLVGAEPSNANAVSFTTNPPVPPREPQSPISSPVIDHSRVSYLQQLGAFYAKLFSEAKAQGNQAKANRYNRAVDKCRELQRKAERGVKIDEAEIPVKPPNFEVKPEATKDMAPAVPARTTSVAPSATASFATPSAPPSSMPPSLPARQNPPPVPVRRDSATTEGRSAAGEDAPEVSKKERIRSILRRRRDAYVVNGKAAVEARDKAAAMEYVSAAKQFEQALAAIESADAEDLDEADIPASPRPYRKPPPPPKTFEEGLLARKERFENLAEEHKRKGDERRMRMNMRQVAQYADAIKNARAGRKVEVSELPSLPDFLPIPPQTFGQSRPEAGERLKTAGGPTHPALKVSLPPVGPFAPSGTTQSRNANQLEFLLQRQVEFKQAALAAKSVGDIELAMKYMKEAKGFDQMINASRGGLPVNIAETPIPPQAISSERSLQPRIAASSEGRKSPSGVDGRGEVLAMLERTLIEQIHLAENNRLRFTRLGDVGKVRLFEDWARCAKRDLVLIREVARQRLVVPKFHYEPRHIPSADLFPDLAEDVLELTILGGVDIPLPAGYEAEHANLFVKYTFPFPSEAHQTGKGRNVTGTRSPEFNDMIVLQIQSRKARGQKLARVLKRTPLKLEIKLDCLEMKAEHEESAALKDGRKAVGGLISARVRIREPLGDNKVNSKVEKWLVIDA